MSDIWDEFKKCIILCANCHREEHHPELILVDLDDMLKDIDEKVISIRTVNKPKCIDCGNDVNYGSKRCKKCLYINRRTIKRPPYNQLLKEIDETNYVIVGKKYGVADNTIRKWIRFYEKSNS